MEIPSQISLSILREFSTFDNKAFNNLKNMFLCQLDENVDLITNLGIPNLPNGVNETVGMCGMFRNSYQTHKAPAYSINKGTMITVASSDVNILGIFKFHNL